jgi:CheY-like chemotaxis protein
MTSLKGLRILFADDARYSMRGTIEALEIAGAKVDVVTDGTEVLEYLRKYKAMLPDLLILDIMMPEGKEIVTPDEGRSTGVEVYKWMQGENIMIPTVVSTVVTDRSILDNLRDQGIPIVQKPYRFEELEREIQKVMPERDKR